jgi:hypothetical protein
MNAYLLGVLTLPVVAAIGYALIAGGAWVCRSIHRGWLSPVEIKDWKTRATQASCVLVARRVWTLKLPGSRLLVFRSTVGGTDYRYGTYFGDTHQLQDRAWAVLMDEFDPR